ncbi:hypothetical protein PoB_000180300 [Plakobranchus ocellatus]|uniref:Uncharacterized protein n=1 Tax=Plakobranchus ocellatus TaxID=259542 RepID=A0AAV3XYJ8_9GAST|nr:hypothetical protein PoB_000180300 [Plakobranchus ocellatus]
MEEYNRGSKSQSCGNLDSGWEGSAQQGDHRLSGPLPGQSSIAAVVGLKLPQKGPCNLRADLLATVPLSSQDRSTNKEDEDEGSPVDDVEVETDDESDEGEGDGLRLDSSDDDGSECRSRSRSSPSTTAEIVLSIFFNIPYITDT